MSDERILGNSNFVELVISQASEKYERHYELKRNGYELGRIVERVRKFMEWHRERFCAKASSSER